MAKDKAQARQEEAEPPRWFTIRTPNPAFKGLRQGVAFIGGMGRSNDAVACRRCRELGYQVELDRD